MFMEPSKEVRIGTGRFLEIFYSQFVGYCLKLDFRYWKGGYWETEKYITCEGFIYTVFNLKFAKVIEKKQTNSIRYKQNLNLL
jgi:hypothetical protein